MYSAVVVFLVTYNANRVFCVSCNPHSDNPSKYEGNLNQKPLDLGEAPCCPLSTVVPVSVFHTANVK